MEQRIIDEQRIIHIAKTTHEVNRAYCLGLGDESQLHWENAPKWQRVSAINGVRAILNGTTTSSEEQHQAWMDEKVADGWTYGPIKDPAEKTHPCLVPFLELSVQDRAKDTLYRTVVLAMLGDAAPAPSNLG